jgi:hypothetical protein
VTREDLESYVESVAGTSVTLAQGTSSSGFVGVTLANTPVEVNPVRSPADYRTKAELAVVANGIHSFAAENFPVTFTYTVNVLTVDVNAFVDCGGTCPTLEYDWDWSDGTAHGTLNPDSHTYTSGGAKSITLTVLVNGLIAGQVTRSLTLATPNMPPVANAACTWNADTWTMTVVDSSSDDGPDADALPPDGNATTQISINWGDGSTQSFGGVGGTFNHVYPLPGAFTVTQKAVDNILQFVTKDCATQATPAYFTISGTVTSKTGTPLGSASVTLMKGSTPVKVVYSAANGTFSFTNLKPGTYNLKVLRAGYTFANPAATKTVGPNQTGFTIATAP